MISSDLYNINISDNISQSLTLDKEALLFFISRYASRRHIPLYMVGGFVRDLFLGLHVKDFDLVLEGDAITFARDLSRELGGRVREHNRFQTATWTINNSTLMNIGIEASGCETITIDIISARSEYYKRAGALPIISPGTIHEDIRRRDFTINTLALRLEDGAFGNLHDELGSVFDMRQGVIRILHKRGFEDDPTRMFRAVRYAQRYGFRIDPETIALIPINLQLLKNISSVRILHEFNIILESEFAASTMSLLDKIGIFAFVHPELRWNRSINNRLQGITSASPDLRRNLGWILWLMDLSKSKIIQISDYFHFPSILRQNILDASKLFFDLDSINNKKPSQCATLLDSMSTIALQAILIAEPRSKASKNITNYLNDWMFVKPMTTGDSLKRLGVPPGPKYQKILQQLKAARLDGEVLSDVDEKEYLDKLVRNE